MYFDTYHGHATRAYQNCVLVVEATPHYPASQKHHYTYQQRYGQHVHDCTQAYTYRGGDHIQ